MKNAKIYVAGHRGLVGSALVRALTMQGYNHLLLRTSSELDLTRQTAVEAFFAAEKPEYVFLAAAKVGGILANNDYPGNFIQENILIQNNVIDAAMKNSVKRLLFFGSSCIYPRDCPQPIKEEYLLTGPLEPTNRPYAVAKISGIEMCWAYNRQFGTHYLSLMPTNLYGPGDNYDLNTSHVLPAILRKMHEAKKMNNPHVELFGTGTVQREFLHSDDLASAALFLMTLPKKSYSALCDIKQAPLINIGSGEEITIKELATLIAETTGFTGAIQWNHNKPDGTPRKLLDISRLSHIGWTPSIPLKEGILSTYESFTRKADHTQCGGRNRLGQ